MIVIFCTFGIYLEFKEDWNSSTTECWKRSRGQKVKCGQALFGLRAPTVSDFFRKFWITWLSRQYVLKSQKGLDRSLVGYNGTRNSHLIWYLYLYYTVVSQYDTVKNQKKQPLNRLRVLSFHFQLFKTFHIIQLKLDNDGGCVIQTLRSIHTETNWTWVIRWNISSLVKLSTGVQGCQV